MANIEDIDAQLQLHLPEAIIQRIQSFLTRKEAASTVVLSKQWYKAWLTRPILDFSKDDFPSVVEFLNFATSSMERYRELNLNINTFKLSINADDTYSSSHATELIVLVLRISSINLNMEFQLPFSFLLPKELFESKSLVRLFVVGGTIPHVNVICSRLKSLILFMVHIEDAMIRRIILNCASLEDLILQNCKGINEVNVGRMVNIKTLTFIRGCRTVRKRTTPVIHFKETGSGTVEFSRLTSLLLERVKIDDEMLFCDFSSKFPCVKNLTVHYCVGCVKFDISSRSINSIDLAISIQKLKIRLDVPNIHKFKFSGVTDIPSLSVVSVSSEWESDVALSCWDDLSFMWFVELNEFLRSLSTSKITLGIELTSVADVEYLSEFADNFKPMVENLTLEVNSLLSDGGVALFDGLFWSFRPRLVNLFVFNTKDDRRPYTITECLRKQSNGLVVLLSKKLMMCPITLQDLHQKSVEILEEYEQWWPLDWTFLYDLEHIEKDGQIRFRLSGCNIEKRTSPTRKDSRS